MGLIKGIANVLKEKAKEELLDYVKKIIEDEKEPETDSSVEKTEQAQAVKLPVKEEAEKEKEKAKPKESEEWIPQVVEEEIEKLLIDKKADSVVVDRLFSKELQALTLEEFALYMKLLFFSFAQRKNFGYLGSSLKKKTGLTDIENDNFDWLTQRLEKRGLLQLEEISANQTTFVLYIPF